MVVRKGCVFVVERSSVVAFQVCPHTCAPTCILDHVAVLRGREGKQYVSETAVHPVFLEFFFLELRVRLPHKWVGEIWLVRSTG